MTRTDKKRVKAAINANRALVDCRIQLRQVAAMCCEAGDLQAEAMIGAALAVLQGVAIYAVKKPRVEVDEAN